MQGEQIDFSIVPSGYTMCLNRECLKAATCLRQMAEQSAPADIVRWNVISPKYLANLEGTCSHYRSSQKVRYAKGFTKMLENLPHKQMRIAISQLTNYFGRTHYYRVRKGERLLSPTDQQKILNLFKNCGASHPQEFDKYVEEYNW